MLFDHKDRILRDGHANKKFRKEYYDKLYKILKKYEKMFHKKIIVCLHPK